MTTYRKSHMTLSSIGIDIGKDVFHLVGFDESGTLVIRRKIKRLALIRDVSAICVKSFSVRAGPCSKSGAVIPLLRN